MSNSMNRRTIRECLLRSEYPPPYVLIFIELLLHTTIVGTYAGDDVTTYASFFRSWSSSSSICGALRDCLFLLFVSMPLMPVVICQGHCVS